ncbi:MAG TPA: zinc-dependent alcohol dehydrogenase family protein [Pirellulaceae bacterium]|nr:zinc-dependent alcohol dehydrogenase family protein [Pirellulaceae bacterium]
MKAQILAETMQLRADSEPLRLVELPDPVPSADEVLIRVQVCGVCHTELDEIEGRAPPAQFPMVLGHQVIGRIAAVGSDVAELAPGDRVGVGWIFSACGDCLYCRTGRENLCAGFLATGRDRPGGYAQLMTANARFVYKIPDALTDEQAAPLMCAGAIGYRSLRLTNLVDGQALGLTGFGASAHIVLQMVRQMLPQTSVYVFARSERERLFAKELGAVWTGNTSDRAPVLLDAIIDTTPAWLPVICALESLAPGGRLIINAIRKESQDRDLLAQLDYPRHLWMEKEIKSVANITRQDIREFLAMAATANWKPTTRLFPLQDANRALTELKTRSIVGAHLLTLE